MKPNDQVYRWMTPSPQTIDAKATVFDAFVAMRRYGIRHLPVIEDAQLVGVVSDRDIALAERLVDERRATVESVMTRDPYVVVPYTPLVEVAEAMARHKYGSAIVIDAARVVGVFTVVDALRAIAAPDHLPAAANDAGSSMDTVADARVRILSDHDRLRDLIERVSTHAAEALRDEKRRSRVRIALAELRTELERHLEYEETTLVPLLTSADAWGAVRAEQLLKDHRGQRALLAAMAEDATDGVRSVEALAEEIAWFADSFERDMYDEEATFLNSEALGEALLVADQGHG